MRKVGCLITLSLLLLLFHHAGSSAAVSDYLQGASLKKTDGVLIVHLKGPAFTRGFQQGYLLRKYIRKFYRDYFLGELLENASSSKLKRWFILQYFKFKARQINRYIPVEFRKEMRGIAQGSGLSYTDILLMHTFLDTMPLLRKIKKSCTNFVLLPSLTDKNELLHGRNLGFSPRRNLLKYQVLFFVEPERGFPFVSFGWPGMCGVLTAMNTNKLSVGETGVGTADLSKTGMPVMFLLRKIIQYSPDMWSALREISKAKRMCGYTITVADGKINNAFVAEIAAKKYEIRFPENGYLIAVNHYLNKRMFETMKPVYPHTKLEETSSYKRLMYFKNVMKNNTKMNLPAVFKILTTPPMGHPGQTLQSVVFLPQELRMYILIKKKELEFSLEKEFGKKYPLKELPDPYKFIRTHLQKISPRLQHEEDRGTYRKLTFMYTSKLNTGLPDKRISIFVILPEHGESYPCLFFLPHSGGVSEFIEENLGKFLAKNGFAFVTLESEAKRHLTPDKDKSGNSVKGKAEQYVNIVKEMLIEGVNTLEWLKQQPFIKKNKIAVGGLSLGSILAEDILGNEEDVNTGIFLLGGADLETFFHKSRLLKPYKKYLSERQQNILLDEISVVDPLNFSFKVKNKNILMMNALFDKDMPRSCTLAYRRALEYPRIIWLPEGHFTSYLSFGYVENKILEFLNVYLNKKKIIKPVHRLGISAPTGEKARIKYEHKNLKIIAGAKYSSYEKKIKLGLEQEEIFNSVFFGGISFSGKWESDTRYNLKSKLMYDMYMGTRLTQNSKIYLGFSSHKYSIYDVDPLAPEEIKRYYGRDKTNFLSLKLLRNTTNDKIYPTRGSYFKFQGDISSKAVGSDFSFYRIQAEYRRYYDLKKERVFVFRTKWGYLDSFGNRGIPFFEKFYMGGSSTIRGYRGRKVGVLDNNLLPLGGNFFGVLNFEARFPLYRKLIYGATFFDTGFLTKKVDELSLDKFKSGCGLGIRIRTKWGFIKFDYGFKIGADKDTSRSHLHVSFGLPF